MITGLYRGKWVKVYIVDATTFDLTEWEDIVLSSSMDVTGRPKIMPVQYSCQNGYNQQNIWPAPMTPGRYFVIVDVNLNGKLDEGIDIVDAVNKAGTTILEDPTVIGFEVY